MWSFKKSPSQRTRPNHFPPKQCPSALRNLPLKPQAPVMLPISKGATRSIFYLGSEAGQRRVGSLLSPRRGVCAASSAQPAQPSPAAVVGAAHGVAAVCVCVAAAPAAQGLVPTQLCLQSSLFLQEAAHLPLPPPLGSCERLSSFPLTPFQGSPGVSPFPGLLTQSDQKSPLLFAAPLVLCSFLSLLFPPPHLRSRLQPWPHLRTPRPAHRLLS